ncbi:MAG: GNAT family N-acetyltransferase [Bacteroidetes bacterium]|nr:GNAT family N-acetyltransferase [Bacteroidota bacterium]
MYQASIPITSEDFKAYYQLRFDVLRKPWNQPLGSEIDKDEDISHHAFIKHNGEILAVCRMQLNTPEIAQLRYMAVSPSMQGKGLGKIIIQFLEEKSKEMGAEKVILHARENAVPSKNLVVTSIVEKSIYYLMKYNII